MNSFLRYWIPGTAALAVTLSAPAATETEPAAPQAPVEIIAAPAPAPETPATPEVEVQPPVVAPEPPAAPEPSVPEKKEVVTPPPEKKEPVAPPKPSPLKTKPHPKKVLISDAVSHEREWDVSLQVFLPDSTYWSAATGLSVGHVNWKWDRWGWGLNFAVAEWNAKGGVMDMPFAKFNDFTLNGSEMTAQVGILGAYRRPLGPKVSLIIKAGIAYQTTQSDLRLTASYVDHYNDQVSYSILAENVDQLVGSAEIALRKNVIWNTRDMYLQASLGYQVLLAGDDPGFLQEDFRMSLEAPSLKLGVGWRW